LSEKKKYRTWTVPQTLEIVLAGLRGDRSVAEVGREHQISENLFLHLAGEAVGGRPGALWKEERLVARSMSLRSWETGFGRGSETARRLRP